VSREAANRRCRCGLEQGAAALLGAWQTDLLTTQDSGRKTGDAALPSSRRATPSQSMLEAINSNLGLQSKADSSRVWARRARGARCAEQACRGTQDSGAKTGDAALPPSRRASPSQRMLEAITSNLGLQSSADSSKVWARRARGARCAEQACRGARTAHRLPTLHLHRACSWRGGVR